MMNKNTTFGYWLPVGQLAKFKIGHYSRPKYVGSVEVPADFNELTIGQIIELSSLGDTNDSLYRVCEIVLGMGARQVNKARAVDVVRFIGWTLSEVERIGKLFRSVDGQVKPSAREQQAGIERLRFGLFGMLDWYAQRMGITDHDDVLGVPWMRIYKCMQMDNEKRAFEARLNKIASEELRTSQRRR